MILVLHNLRSAYNVGAILRTAEGLGVSEVIFSGYTPAYDDSSLLPHLREKLNHQIRKSALGAETMLRTQKIADLPAWLQTQKSPKAQPCPEAQAQKSQSATIIGLENNLSPAEQDRRLLLGSPSAQKLLATHAASGQNLILILGEEVAGIPPEIRPELDFFLEIPMRGQKESFNVSVAAAIALWELLGRN